MSIAIFLVFLDLIWMSQSLSKWMELIKWSYKTPPIMLTIEPRTVGKFWVCNYLISINHMSSWCPILDPHLSTYYASIGNRYPHLGGFGLTPIYLKRTLINTTPIMVFHGTCVIVSLAYYEVCARLHYWSIISSLVLPHMALIIKCTY